MTRVWAPRAERVDLVTGDVRAGMRRAESGWWETTDSLPPGIDYAFSLDGGTPRPDPRSPWQPHGVHAPSRALDHSDFDWSDSAWRGRPLAATVLYELHVGTFTPGGTFYSAIDKLDHLVRLGIGAVELMPIAEFAGTRGWGYDGVDLYAPHHAYGGPHGMKTFVDACHSRGIAVVLDVVYNHLGPAGNYLAEFGPYFTDRYATPWGAAINFDGRDSDEVRAFFLDNAEMWLVDYHVDGLRFDAVHAIVDTSATHILEELADRVETLEARVGRELWAIAESDLNDPRLVRSRSVGGYGMDAQWSDDFHHALHAVLTGERSGYYADFGAISDVAVALRQAFVYDGRHSRYRGRRHGRSTEELSGHRFLGYLQNHDQVGNRARGERGGALMSTDLLKVGAALVMAAPFVPMLFHGEEWGATTPFLYFTDHDDELGRSVGDGRRREFAAFGWDPDDIPDPQAEATFASSVLDWGELADPLHADLMEWHRRLIALRRERPELTDGRMDGVHTLYDEDGRWLVVRRGSTTLACNFGTAPVAVPVGSQRGSLLLASPKSPDGVEDVVMEPASVAFWGS